ncbi:hypothetical protein ACH4F6_03845 [Streptomyces sp. NPDC017936]|uniref:hypothetical protein n=1 Tax=Streptomyces sp. NPDC017936 TaxID=3365016 RepID=UPI0037B15C47
MAQQPQRGQTGRITSTARPARGAALVAGLALLPLAAACSGDARDTVPDGGPAEVTAAPAAGVVAPAKVEVIAGLTGCTATIRIEADELREGVCHTDAADYVITTFPAEKYQSAWLDAAAVYGGTYLVGERWVVAAEPEKLERFRAKLGGTVRRPRDAGPATAPSAS